MDKGVPANKGDHLCQYTVLKNLVVGVIPENHTHMLNSTCDWGEAAVKALLLGTDEGTDQVTTA